LVWMSLSAGLFAAEDWAELLPAETDLVVSISGPSALIEKLCDEELKDAWERFKKDECWSDIEDRWEVSPVEWLEELSGSWVFFARDLSSFAAAGPAPADVEFERAIASTIGFLLGVPDEAPPKEKFRDDLEKLVDRMNEEQGGDVELREDRVEGLPVLIMKDRKAGKSPQIYFAWIDSFLFVGAGKETVQKLAAVSQGAPSLAESEKWRKSTGRVGPEDCDAFAYLDIPRLKEAMLKSSAPPKDEEGPFAEYRRRTFKTTKLLFDVVFRNLGPACIGLEVGEGELVGKASIATQSGGKPGFVNMIGRLQGLRFPDWTWPGNGEWSVVALDAGSLRSVVVELISGTAAVQGGEEAAKNWPNTVRAFLGLDLEKDLLGSLGDRIVAGGPTEKEVAAVDGLLASIQEEGTFGGMRELTSPEMPGVIAFALKDPKPWKTTLDRLMSSMAGVFKSQDYMGAKLYSIEMPGAQGGVSIGVADLWLLFGSREGVEKAIRRFKSQGGGLESEKEIERSFAALPEGNAGRQYVHYERLVSAGMLKKIRSHLKKVSDSEKLEPVERALLEFATAVLASDFWEKCGVRAASILRWDSDGLYSEGRCELLK